jgi:peptide/nickel transport system substrate-binding protein
MLDTPPRSRLDEIATNFSAQAHASVHSLVYYLVPNTKSPPFDSHEARIALNLAVDRSRFVRLFGGPRLAEPTCQVLPPNFPGYRPYCPYTRNPDPTGEWKGPRLEQARALAASWSRTVWHSSAPGK